MPDVRAVFQRDGGQLLDSLEQIFPRLADDTNTVHQAFRYIHSFRSQAAFLGLEALTEKSTEIEDILAALRVQEKPLEKSLQTKLVGLLEEIRQGFDTFAGQAEQLEQAEQVVQANQQEMDLAKGEKSAFPTAYTYTMASLLSADASASDILAVASAAERNLERLVWVHILLDEEPAFVKQRRYMLLYLLERQMAVLAHTGLETAGMEFGVLVAIEEGTKLHTIEDYLATSGILDVRIQPTAYDALRECFSHDPSRDAGMFADAENVNLSLTAREYERLLFTMSYISRGDPAAEDSFALFRRSSMVQLSDIFSSVKKLASDSAAEQGKKVDCRIQHSDAAVPVSVASVLAEAVTHLVRNAVDHGIESPQERLAAGKNESGMLHLRTEQNQNWIIVSVQDDGAGIQPKEGESTADLFNRLASPGFSTVRDQAESFSGRGVGLDVVKHAAEHLLRGHVELHIDQGTEFQLYIPADIQLIRILLVYDQHDTPIAIPAFCVYGRYELNADTCGRTLDGRNYYIHSGDHLEIVDCKGSASAYNPTCREGILIEHADMRKVVCCRRAFAEETVVLQQDRVFSEVLQQDVFLWNPWLALQ